MTKLETFLLAALSGTAMYRVGWLVGAHRMSSALAGHSVGIFAWWHRRRTKKVADDILAELKDMGEKVRGETSSADPGDTAGGMYL